MSDIQRALTEALPYMTRNAGRTIVVKYGGHAMECADSARLFARDIALLRQTGCHPIVVHGGGPSIKQMLARLDIQTPFVDGMRVTDKDTMNVVEMVLSGPLNKSIVADINAEGVMAVGLSGRDGGLIHADYLRPLGDDGTPVDLGLVGTPRHVNTEILERFLQADIVPVIAPIGSGIGGESLNINADTAAGAVASATKARRLLMLSDIPGVLDKEGNLISQLTASNARTLIREGVISGGMIPKVETCLQAVQKGVQGAVILDGRVPHAVVQELFSEGGAGTLILPDTDAPHVLTKG